MRGRERRECRTGFPGWAASGGLELPAGDGVREVFGVFILAESNLRSDAKDASAGALEKGADVAAVFAIVDFDELLPDGTIFDFLGGTFEDDSFVGLFSADDNVRIRGHIFCFARARTGAEPESILPPNSPDQHEMRATVGASRGDPIVVRFFEPFESPWPWFESA